MVTRKQPPGGAAGNPAVPPQVHELWSGAESDSGAARHWEEEGRAVDVQQSSSSSRADLPPDVPNSLRPGLQPSYSPREADQNVWVDLGSNETPADRKAAGSDDGVPLALRPGGGVARPETNPFKKRLSRGDEQKPAGGGPVQGSDGPPLLSISSFSQLSLDDTSSNPWGPTPGERNADVRPPASTAFVDPPPDAELPKDIWNSARPSRQPTPGASASPGLVSLPSEEDSAGWDEEASRPAPPSTTIPLPDADEEALETSHAWDDLGIPDRGAANQEPRPVVAGPPSTEAGDGWNLVDVDIRPSTPPPDYTPEPTTNAPSGPTTAAPGADAESWATAGVETGRGQPPDLPPREPTTSLPAAAPAQPPPPPPPPPQPTTSGPSETYQVKNVTWYDVGTGDTLRTTPILVQSANGPCPLVALVNALTLTAPPDTTTALVETLQPREQVSLGLLLDAVFDELMSSSPGRHLPADAALPDVGELYEFLKGLHTGMNVNPRFVPTPEAAEAYRRTSLAHLHPAEREEMIPGSFEDTREMRLYSTFSIPLIHGWLPRRDEPAREALARRAASYEDAQNLLFREEELEAKLSGRPSQGGEEHEGLSEEEQELYRDIVLIKNFLQTSATQLTPWGLEVIRHAMRPGSVAILFRNDHFSTLYRHPETLDLFALVTDAGYAGHAEVVWESLVDVTGENAEFFSGDFRPVGGAHHQQAGQQQQQEQEERRRQQPPVYQQQQQQQQQPPPQRRQQPQQQEQRQRQSRGSMPGSYPAAVAAAPEPEQPPPKSARQSFWTAVRGRRNRNQQSESGSTAEPRATAPPTPPPPQPAQPPVSPKQEQEDRDFAFALQLQEEEEERHRAEVARRRERESRGPQQYQ